jgi:hypothetical protein
MYRSRDIAHKEKLPENILERPYAKKMETMVQSRTNPLQTRTKRQSQTTIAVLKALVPEADDFDAAEKLEMEMDADADVEQTEGAKRYEMDADVGAGKSGDESAGSVRS